MTTSPDHRNNGFSLLEVATSLGIIVALLAVLIPALSSARSLSHLKSCADSQRRFCECWNMYLGENDEQFPFVPVQPGWQYAGVRFSVVDGLPFLDSFRPLTPYLPTTTNPEDLESLFHCPADYGITDVYGSLGTGRRTAFRSFGTSYRANANLLDARIFGLSDEPRGLYRSEISIYPSRMLLMGDPIWHETYEQTGLDARWHGDPVKGNLLFLDGSVRFMAVRPRGDRGPAVVEPTLDLKR